MRCPITGAENEGGKKMNPVHYDQKHARCGGKLAIICESAKFSFVEIDNHNVFGA